VPDDPAIDRRDPGADRRACDEAAEITQEVRGIPVRLMHGAGELSASVQIDLGPLPHEPADRVAPGHPTALAQAASHDPSVPTDRSASPIAWVAAESWHSQAVPEVHVATLAEAPVLAELQRRSALAAYRHIFPPEAPTPTFDRLLSLWESWLGSGALTGFVAEVAGDSVGVVLAGADPSEVTVGHMARMYVAPERWRQGIGRLLYAVAIDHLGGAGYTEATLWVLENNDRARSWYERLGWVATGERKSVFQPAAIDELRYRRELDR